MICKAYARRSVITRTPARTRTHTHICIWDSTVTPVIVQSGWLHKRGKRWGILMTSSLGAGPALPRDSVQWQRRRVTPAGPGRGNKKKNLFVSYQNHTVYIFSRTSSRAHMWTSPGCLGLTLLHRIFKAFFSRHIFRMRLMCAYVSQPKGEKQNTGRVMQIYTQPTSVRN